MARTLGAVSLTALGLFLSTALGSGAELAQAAPCDPPIQNAIVCENSKPGNPQSEWDVSGGGDPSIQGFATDISVDHGETVHFKIDTPSTAYHLDIYRMGYYGGDGARKVATVTPSASLPQAQPNCLDDTTTGLIDCGNWAESASWAVPADAVSGIYFAKLVRTDQPSDGSHIFFIVRDDASHSKLLFQTSDTTWEAYNQYGGRSLYSSDTGGPGTNPDRAYKVSYNRPLTVRGGIPEDSPFNAEYPMVRWLERNGYDVSYFTGVDSARFGSEILEHKTFLSVGHDEYWSGDSARQHRGGPGRRCQPRLLLGQRELLEDPLGAQHRRWLDHRLANPGLLQGDPRQRQDRPRAAATPTSGPGLGAIPASARRPTAVVRRTRSRARCSGSTPAPPRSTCRRPTARCASGATPASPRRPQAKPPP